MVCDESINLELLDRGEILSRWLADAPAWPIGELGDARLLAQPLVNFIVSGAGARVVSWNCFTLLMIKRLHEALGALARG